MRGLAGEPIHCVDGTDSLGWAEVFGVPGARVLMDVSHGSEELEFVLDASGGIELRILDGETPLGNVITRIETSDGWP